MKKNIDQELESMKADIASLNYAYNEARKACDRNYRAIENIERTAATNFNVSEIRDLLYKLAAIIGYKRVNYLPGAECWVKIKNCSTCKQEIK